MGLIQHRQSLYGVTKLNTQCVIATSVGIFYGLEGQDYGFGQRVRCALLHVPGHVLIWVCIRTAGSPIG